MTDKQLDAHRAKFASVGNEAATLACVLKDPSLYYTVEQKLRTEDFLSPHHRALYTIIKSLIREGVASIDSAAVLTQAAALGLEKQIGGYEYVSALFDKHVDPNNLNFYVERVADTSIKLRLALIAEDIKELVEENKSLSDSTLPAKDLVDLAQSKILQVALEEQRSADAINVNEGLYELLEEVTQSADRIRGLETGFPLLDDAINGLEPGTLTVVGARPKVGKSALLMNWAKHIAYAQGLPVLYIDTEMSLREQQFRLLSMLSQVPEREIKNGLFQNDLVKKEQVEMAYEVMSKGLLFHKYYPDFTAEGIASLARKFFHQHGLACLIFDYIKLPDADLQNSQHVKEYQALGYLCVALKNLAGQLQIPIVTAAQIGRLGANKGRVTSADFADSDRILRYANTLLGLARKTADELTQAEEHYGREEARALGTHRLQILDTRAGGTDYGGIDIYFRQDVLTLREADKQTYQLRGDSFEQSRTDQGMELVQEE